MSKQQILSVRVTQDDINKGKPGNEYFCPIALALRKQGHERVSVVDGYATLGRNKDMYILPHKAREFVNDFDDCFIVKPFSFSACILE